jgi:hypothetical protein
MSSGTFAAFSKFHLYTSKSPNIEVAQFFKGHNFHVGWHCKFGVEKSEKLGQLQPSTIHRKRVAFKVWSQFMQNPLLKHHRAILEVVEGNLLYIFAIQSFRSLD